MMPYQPGVTKRFRCPCFHSSAALGTAIYRKDGDEWAQVQDFTWHGRNTNNRESAQAKRTEFFPPEGWVAANGRMGTPNELEYQINQDHHTCLAQ